MASNAAGQVHLDVEGSQPAQHRIRPLFSIPLPGYLAIDEKKETPLTPSESLGLNEFFVLDVWRASVGELLGTAVLVFMLDTIVISTYETEIQVPNLVMSILIGIALTILLIALFPISGGHINPAITFSAALVGLISISRATIYILAQCIGAALGAFALKAVISSTIERNFSLGGCTITIIAPGANGPVTTGLETGQAFCLEVICTFILLFVTVWTAFDHRQAKKLGLVLVCATIGAVAGLLVYESTTVTMKRGYGGAGMNPARCFGAAVVRGGHLWDGHWIFWAGPAIACFAFYIYIKIIPKEHFYAEGYKHDFFGVIMALIK